MDYKWCVCDMDGIDRETADVIIEYCFENSVNFLVYTKNMVYSNINNPRAKHFEDLNKTLLWTIFTPYKKIWLTGHIK